MIILLSCIIGLVAGVAGAMRARTPTFGLVPEVLAAVAGACLATVLTAKIGWRAPFGVVGAGVLAAFGAVGAIVLVRILHHSTIKPEPVRGARRR